MGLTRINRGLGAIALAAVFLTGCGDDGGDDDNADDTSSETSETPSEDTTTEASTDTTTEAESVDPNALTEPTWIDGQEGFYTATDISEGQPADGAVGFYIVAVQGDHEAQGPEEPDVGLHDHVIALLPDPTPCAAYKLYAAEGVPAEVVTTDEQGLAEQINLGSGLVAIDNSDVIDQGIAASLLKAEFEGIIGMCTSEIG